MFSCAPLTGPGQPAEEEAKSWRGRAPANSSRERGFATPQRNTTRQYQRRCGSARLARELPTPKRLAFDGDCGGSGVGSGFRGSGLPDLEAGKTTHADVFADLGDHLLDHLANGDTLILDEVLFIEAVLFVKLFQLAGHDF